MTPPAVTSRPWLSVYALPLVFACSSETGATDPNDLSWAKQPTQNVEECEADPNSNPLNPTLRIVSNLDSYCRARASAGLTPCPQRRGDVLASVAEVCSREALIVHFRECGLDQIDEEDFRTPSQQTWIFDAATEALVGASGFLAGMPCGSGHYSAGISRAYWPGCPESRLGMTGRCDSLCLQGQPYCPADIEAALGHVPCDPSRPPGGGRCPPDTPDPFASFVDHAECSAAPCGEWQSGTCGGSCNCFRDGVYRWDNYCAE